MMGETKAQREQREADEAAAAAVAEAAAGSDVLDDEDAAKGGKVKVDQSEGEIVLTRGVDVVLTKTVKDGHVTADDANELAVLLGSVPGAVLVED